MQRYVFICFLVLVVACRSTSPDPTPSLDVAAATTIRINAGGPAVTVNSVGWAADQYFVGGKSYSNTKVTDIQGTTDDVLYRTERSSTSNLGSFSYRIPLNNGDYQVTLHFAEIYWGATGGGSGSVGKRVFSTNLEGGPIELSGYDIYAEVGAMTATKKTYTATVSDGILNIDFSSTVNQPKLSALEIVPVAVPIGNSVAKLMLVNADTKQDIGPMYDGITLDFTTIGTKNLSVRAETNPSVVGSVRFALDTNSNFRTESVKPYTLNGDNGPDYYAWTPSVGDHTLSATPYSKSSATGTVGTSLSVRFNVVDGDGSQGGAWRTFASSSQNRQEVAYTQVGGKFYLAGGSTLHEVYDPVSNVWRTIAPLPVRLDHILSVSIGSLIYYIGGLSGWPGPNVNTVYIYDTVNNSFSQGAQMPIGRGRGAGGVTVYNGKIYYVGGLSGDNSSARAVSWLDVYDPEKNSWASLPNMPRARDHFQAVVVSDILYAIGGRDKNIDATISAVDTYDFATGRWSTPNTQLPTPRGGFAVALAGQEILVIGGEGHNKTYTQVEAYNVSTNTWRTLSPMPTARHGVQAAVCSGGIYLAAGGRTQGGSNPTNIHEAFFPSGVTTCGTPQPNEPSPSKFTKVRWQEVAKAPLGVTEAQGTVVNGKLYVFGGYVSWSPFCATTQAHVYDPSRNIWSTLPNFPEPWTHAGVATDGKDIYIAGGYNNSPNCNRNEVATTAIWKFNVDAKTWSIVAHLPQARGAGGLVMSGRNLHFFGGTDTSRTDKNEHWMLPLDGSTGWKSLAPLPNGRSHISYAVLNGKLYAIGGQYSYEKNAQTQTLVHTYTPELNRWEKVASLPLPLSHASSTTFVLDGRIIVLGGERAHVQDVDNVLAYEPTNNTWTNLTPLPAKRNAGVGGVIDGALFFTGGSDFSTNTYKGQPY